MVKRLPILLCFTAVLSSPVLNSLEPEPDDSEELSVSQQATVHGNCRIKYCNSNPWRYWRNNKYHGNGGTCQKRCEKLAYTTVCRLGQNSNGIIGAKRKGKHICASKSEWFLQRWIRMERRGAPEECKNVPRYKYKSNDPGLKNSAFRNKKFTECYLYIMGTIDCGYPGNYCTRCGEKDTECEDAMNGITKTYYSPPSPPPYETGHGGSANGYTCCKSMECPDRPDFCEEGFECKWDVQPVYKTCQRK